MWEDEFLKLIEAQTPSPERTDNERFADSLQKIRERLQRTEALGTFDPELTMRVLAEIQSAGRGTAVTFDITSADRAVLLECAWRLAGPAVFEVISDKENALVVRGELDSAGGLLIAVLRKWHKAGMFSVKSIEST